jgi:hypothetical protein
VYLGATNGEGNLLHMKSEKYVVKNTAGMFDLLKGITMFAIVVDHTLTLFPSNFVYQAALENSSDPQIVSTVALTLYSIFEHALMPSLFLICGYGFRKNSFKKNISKQFKSLMIPYIITAFLTAGLLLCTHYCLYRHFKDSFKEALSQLGGSMLGFPITTTFGGIKFFFCGPSWFIMALFIGMIIFNALLAFFDNIKLFIAVLLVATFGWLISLVITTPWCISQGCVCVFFIYLGYYAKKHKLFVEGIDIKKKVAYVILVFIPYVVLRALGYIDSMTESYYPFGIITIALNGLFALCFIYAFLLLNRFNGIISSSIRSVGRYSIYIVCIHTIDMMGFPLYHFAEKFEDTPLTVIVFSMIRVAVVFGICFLFIKTKDFVLSKAADKKIPDKNI